MRGKMTRAAPGLTAFACLLAASRAGASTAAAAPVHLSYTAPPGCPDEVAFLEMIARDGASLERAAENEPAQSFDITVEASDTVAGRLVVRKIDGTQSERAVVGPHCDEVVRSLAVIVALSVDSDPAPKVVSKLTIGATGAAPGVGTAAGGPAADDAERPAPARVRPVSDTFEAPAQGPDPWRRRWRVGASVELGGSAGPSPAPGWTVGFYGEVMHETPDLFAPSLRVGIEKSWGATEQLRVYSLDKLVARVDACPWRLVATQPWSDDGFTAQMCARADVGWVDASSSPGAPSVRRAWVAPGGLLRLRWLFPGSFLEAEAGVDLPLTRYRFSSSDGLDFEAPRATGMVGFGYGLLFL